MRLGRARGAACPRETSITRPECGRGKENVCLGHYHTNHHCRPPTRCARSRCTADAGTRRQSKAPITERSVRCLRRITLPRCARNDIVCWRGPESPHAAAASPVSRSRVWRSSRVIAAASASIWGRSRDLERRREPPVGDDDHPVGGLVDLQHLGAEHDHGIAVVGEVAEQPVDLALALDVDAAGRLLEQQQPRLERAAPGRSPPSAGCRRRASGWPASASAS